MYSQNVLKCAENTVNATDGDPNVHLSCNATDAGHEIVKEAEWKYWAPVPDFIFYYQLGRRTGGHYRSWKHALDTSDNTTLIISNISVEDTGVYTCVEDYGHGKQHRHHLNVWPKCLIYHLMSCMFQYF